MDTKQIAHDLAISYLNSLKLDFANTSEYFKEYKKIFAQFYEYLTLGT